MEARLQVKGESYLDAAPANDFIPVFEQSTGFFYRADARSFGNPVGAQTAGIPRIRQNLKTWLGNVLVRDGCALVQGRLQPHLGGIEYLSSETTT